MLNQSLMICKAITTDTGEWTTGYYVNSPAMGHVLAYNDEVKSIRPGTICCSTGLFDEHGKLIYENDIIDAVNYRGVVVSTGGGGFEIEYKEGWETIKEDLFEFLQEIPVLIVGNKITTEAILNALES